jgi:hypothetical protein
MLGYFYFRQVYQLAKFVFITDVSKNLQYFFHVHDHFI